MMWNKHLSHFFHKKVWLDGIEGTTKTIKHNSNGVSRIVKVAIDIV